MANKGFSIIIPTYTGKDQIVYCLQSIISQRHQPKTYEVIVVVDGSKEILSIVKDAEPEFKSKKIPFRIIFNEKNIGHFEARIIGAKAARYEKLLFVDDRIRLNDNFFAYIENTEQDAIMPNVIEQETSNIISMTLNMLRKLIYGKKYGNEQSDYYVHVDNFNKSPKGTGGLYLQKKIFLGACKEVKRNPRQPSKQVNDDTKVLELVVRTGTNIFRPGKLLIYYAPRSGFKEAWLHLFRRGPKFVDYYHKAGTRFFPLLATIYLVVIVLVIIIILSPIWFVYCLIASMICVVVFSAFIAQSIKQYLVALVGLPLVIVVFSAGILTGTVLRITSK